MKYYINFIEPSSLFSYNLISLHHDVIWYLILVISVVYWSIYKIFKDYGWFKYNSESVFFDFLLYKNIWYKKLIVYIIGIYIYIFKYILEYIYNFFFFLVVFFFCNLDTKKSLLNRISYWMLFNIFGKSSIEGLYDITPVIIDNQFDIGFLINERFLSYLLCDKSSNGLFYYNGFDNYLDAESFKHSTILEYIYGGFSSYIIICIILPSLYLLYSSESDINPVVTIKIIGHQWYWSYEYTYFNLSSDIISYDSVFIGESDLSKGFKRLLEADKFIVLPKDLYVRLLVTSSDVLHAWSIPDLGVKTDAVPGRLNQILLIVSRLGLFYGQCSELCGVSHGFMPITLQCINTNEFINSLENIESSEKSLDFEPEKIDFGPLDEPKSSDEPKSDEPTVDIVKKDLTNLTPEEEEEYIKNATPAEREDYYIKKFRMLTILEELNVLRRKYPKS